MRTIVITGDRSAHGGVAVTCIQQILIRELIAAKGDDLHVVVGLDQGVEAAVRFVVQAAPGIALVDVQWMNKDWDDYAVRLSEEQPAKVYFIHSDPMASKLFPALDKSALGEFVELTAPELIFA